MRRLLKFLVRLYPSDWRRRYGVEYEALLDEATPRAQDAFDVLWQALKMQAKSWNLVNVVLPCAICGALVTAAISFSIPPQYVSQSVILVAAVDDGGHPTGNTDDLDASFRDALSETSLAPIIQKLNLYPHERAHMSQKDVIDRMRKDIYVKPVMKRPGHDVFALQFSYPDPHVAQDVDAELVSGMMTSSLYLAENHHLTTPHRYETFRLETDASLPLQPSFPKRGVSSVVGLFAGMAGGLLIAAFMRRRRETVTAA